MEEERRLKEKVKEVARIGRERPDSLLSGREHQFKKGRSPLALGDDVSLYSNKRCHHFPLYNIPRKSLPVMPSPQELFGILRVFIFDFLF